MIVSATGAGSDIISRRLPVPPNLLALHRANPQRYPQLLESVAHEREHGRYDILFACPLQTLIAYHDRTEVDGQPIAGIEAGGFLNAFDHEWRKTHSAIVVDVHDQNLPPFRGGWFIYLSYELAAEIEPSLAFASAAPDDVVACAMRVPAAVIHDHVRRESYIVCESAHADAVVALLESDCSTAPAQSTLPEVGAPIPVTSLSEEAAEIYLDNIARVQAYIRSGDVFQVNLSRQWRAQLTRDTAAVDIYERLRGANPAPFAGLMRCADMAIISSSPERLVQVRAGVVRTRPIAGTYPRSGDAAEDRLLSQELLRHPKERAEHIMLIDLERNDLGRICATGSVKVSELMTLESYRYVHHIVSEVSGRLRPTIAPVDVIRAIFPGGTITGCPKVRCMEIIAELERAPRGAYTGAMGYVNRDGSMDLNILIRTLVQRGKAIAFRAGGGIVADSDPQRELNETRAKARGLRNIFAPTPHA